jgi:hypothetical protein
MGAQLRVVRFEQASLVREGLKHWLTARRAEHTIVRFPLAVKLKASETCAFPLLVRIARGMLSGSLRLNKDTHPKVCRHV